jgi:hypothetical protein
MLKPFVIPSQLLEEFHNEVQCWHGALFTNGKGATTTSNGYVVNTFVSNSPKLLLEVVTIVFKVIATFGAIVLWVIET